MVGQFVDLDQIAPQTYYDFPSSPTQGAYLYPMQQQVYSDRSMDQFDQFMMPDAPIPGFNGLGQLLPPISAQTKNIVVLGAVGLLVGSILFWAMRRKKR